MKHLVLAFVTVLSCAGVSAQGPRKITVATVKGDTIEGALRSLTADQVVIEIAGQAVSIALADVKYVSFVGKIEGASVTASGASSPMSKAFEALRTLREVTQVGVLRDQYSAKLIETVPAIQQFVTNTQGWNDLREALTYSVANFKAPMDDLASWKNAGTSMGIANAWAEYAEKLSKLPDEAAHKEAQETKNILIGGTLSGRLGFGDRQMDKVVDPSTAGGFNDVVTLSVPTRLSLDLTMSCSPCRAHLTVTDATGKQIEGDGGQRATIRRTFEPGTYLIWAGTYNYQVGEYRLSVAIR